MLDRLLGALSSRSRSTGETAARGRVNRGSGRLFTGDDVEKGPGVAGARGCTWRPGRARARACRATDTATGATVSTVSPAGRRVRLPSWIPHPHHHHHPSPCWQCPLAMLNLPSTWTPGGPSFIWSRTLAGRRSDSRPPSSTWHMPRLLAFAPVDLLTVTCSRTRLRRLPSRESSGMVSVASAWLLRGGRHALWPLRSTAP